MRVVVVGAGIGGLSAACHLVGGGHDVVVVERGDAPGGRAGVLRRGGYQFETGPTVLTMPALLQEAINAAGSDLSDLLSLSPLDPIYRANFADGSVICVRRGREAMADELRRTCGPREAAAFEKFADWLTELYELELGSFINRNFDSPLDLVRPLAPALRLIAMGGLRRLAPRVRAFFADDRLQRLFSFQSLYAGLAPYEALALYSVITYMDTIGGVYYPAGGVHAVPTALATAAVKGGADLRLQSPVERIVLAGHKEGPVRGVALAGGEFLPADAVVCNADLPAAYRSLLPGLAAPRVARTGRYSPSAIVWHAGVAGTLPGGTAHHNIHFGTEWDSSFRAVLDDGRRMPDPSLLVTVPTVDDPGVAPPGRHTLYVLEPVPNLDAALDWATERERAHGEMVARVAGFGYPTDVEVEAFIDPTDWQRAGLERGTPFSLAHRFFQTGPFRAGNVEARAPGLVFVGAGTVPGVGVPMVLLSGRLAAARVEAMAV